ncbi:oral-facial-digital syndrome 1 protein homolog isoform X2 [Melanotaenia boesemani]|uniref:oral-facial-digital syndrome 1 protein homolog isoform X2 n=1 Tax=Melanotaenia boesemani TaxID=1250792 RepID=UPI001C048AAE|nr:oral-facial-digital syndrome 1 protein homolog isoform X2 [Melanotaenia boesemani]
MSSSKEDALSPEELRKRLYQTFKNKGVLDALKAHLRNQFIQELKYPPLTGAEPGPRPVPVKSEPLLVSACNSIVADHLRASGYEYTLSVFYPESGLCKDKIFKKEDLLQLLQISPASPLCTFLSNEENNSKGFLFNLLTQLTHHHTQSLGHDVDTQTINLSNYGESLVEKMKMIDKEYESFSSKEDKMFSFQSKLAAYRNETIAQMEAEMNTKLQHFKEVEIAKMKTEEKSKFYKELAKLKQELEKAYEMKAKALMEREKNAFEKLQKQQEIEEKNVYIQRQSVLKEIEKLRNRESELRVRMEAFEKTCQIHTEKVKATDELLRRRELAVRTIEDTYDQKLKNELARCQLELKEDYIKRTESLTESENRNKVETAQIQKEAAVINAQLEEHNRACREMKRLQDELDTAQQQISLLTQQKELLRERLESTSDYPIMKRQKAELQGQLQLLQKQLEESQEENLRLHAEMTKPSKEQLALQRELQRLQNARRLDEEEFDSQKQVLQAQLQNEVELCAQLKAQLIDSEERSQRLIKDVEDIKMQLCQTHQMMAALENEVLRNPKPSLVDRSVLELSTDKLVPPDIYTDRALLRARVGYVDVCEAGGPSRGHTSPWIDSPDSDIELVAEAKARIQELQRETETLEEAYRKYQQRAVYSTISHMLPSRPLSPQPAHSPHHPNPLRKQDSHHSHIHSTHKSKMSLKPLSPQRVQSPILVSHDTRNPSTHAQHSVTFSEDQLPASVVTDHRHHLETESLFLRDEQPQDQSFTPSNHPSYTPKTFSEKELERESTEEAVVSLVTFPQLPSDRQISRGPLSEGATLGDFSPELSPPHSPQLKSTARDQSSSPKLQPVFSSSDSSPQPEKINLEDLTVISSEPGHIPQLLLDTAVPLSEEAPDGPTTPHPQDLPEDPTDLQGQPEVPQTSSESARMEEEEDDEQRWERERKERQERRQKELEEAKERERQELERLEKEMLLQEVEQPEQEEKEMEVKKEVDEEEKEEADNKEAKDQNPLEKYMKMVLEAREKQHMQNPVREETGQTSPEDKSLSEEKEESIAAFSPKEEEDDDFW